MAGSCRTQTGYEPCASGERGIRLTGSDEHVAWTGHERGSTGYTRILIALLCAGVATFAQIYSPQGLLPLISRDLGVSASQASLVISAATTGVAVSVLPWSLVADRLGRLAAMRIALIAATTCGLIMPWLPWLEGLVAIRFIEGVALGGIPAIAVTYLTEEVSKRHVAIAAGSYVSGTTIGGLSGRLIAGPIGELTNWRIGAFAVAIVGAIMMLLFLTLTPKPRGFTPHRVSAGSVLRAVGTHMRNPKLTVLYAQGFLLMGGFVAVYNYLTFRLEGEPFLIPPGIASFLFLAYLAGTVSSGVTARAVMRFGRGKALLATISLMIAGALLTLAPSLWVIIAGLLIMTGGYFGAHSIALGWSGARAEDNRGQSTSLYYLWFYIGSGLFGYLGGIPFAHFGWAGVVAMVTGLSLIALIWAAIAAKE